MKVGSSSRGETLFRGSTAAQEGDGWMDAIESRGKNPSPVTGCRRRLRLIQLSRRRCINEQHFILPPLYCSLV